MDRTRIKYLIIGVALASVAFSGVQHERQSPSGVIDAIDPVLQILAPVQTDTILYGNTVSVQWQAADSTFSEKPIRIAYRTLPFGPVTSIIDSTENDGDYDWLIPESVDGLVELYVTAFDRFGNATTRVSSALRILGQNPGPRWFVATSGSDTHNNGTADFPYRSIQKALASAISGDTVFVAPGVYYENPDDLGKNLMITSRQASQPATITSTSGTALLTLRGNSTVRNLNLIGPGSVSSTDGIQILQGKAIVTGLRLSRVRNGITCAGLSHPLLSNNLITECAIGVVIQEQTTPALINNTIAGNAGGIRITGYKDSCLVRNNIIAFNDSQNGIASATDAANIRLGFNNVWGNQPANYSGLLDVTGSGGNLSSDPQFADRLNGNYHLLPYSASINAGDPQSDYHLEPEPNGDRINLGVFGGTPEAEVGALQFVENPLTSTAEDALYFQTLGILPDKGVVFEYNPLSLPSWLELNSTDGFLRGTPDNSQVGTHRIQLTVFDNYSRSDTLDYILTVTNTLPYFSSIPDSNCLEDVLWQYDAQTSDEGQGRCHYTLLEPEWLTIDTLSGKISGVPTNTEVGVHQVTIQFEDGNGGVIWQRFNLTVINVNDAPVLQPLPEVVTAEDQAVVIRFADWLAYASDVDNDVSTLQWRVYSGAHASVISRLDSAIVTPTKDWFGDEAIKVVIKDTALTDTNYFTLRVTPVNDPPVWNLPDEKTILSSDSLRLYLPGFVTDIDDPVNNLKFSAQPAFNPEEYHLQIALTGDNFLIARPGSRTELDRGKIYLTVTDTSKAIVLDSLLLTVIKVNLAPKLTASLPIITGDEETTTKVDITTWRNYVTDDDDDISQLGWQVLRSPHIDTRLANDTLTLTPVSNWFGEEFLPVLVFDEKDTAYGFVTVQIRNIPDAPELNIPPHLSFNEDEELIIALDDWVNDVDTPDSLITWMIVVEDQPAELYFELKSVARQIRFWGGPDFYTPDSVRVNYYVNDETGLIASSMNYIRILPVNDAPTLPAVLPDWQNQYEDRGFAIDVRSFYPLANDPETPAEQLQWSLASGRKVFISSNVSPTEYLLASPPDWWGNDTLTLRASDGEFIAIAKLPVFLQSVNDPPIIIALPDTSFNEDDTLSLRLNDYIYDVDSPVAKMSWQVTTESPSGMLLITLNPTTGELILTGKPDAFAEHIPVYYRVTDDSGATAFDTNYVTITPVNDPPYFAMCLDTSYFEDEVLTISRSQWAEYLKDVDNDTSELTFSVKKDSGVVFYKFDKAFDSHQFWSNQDVNGVGYFTATLTDPAQASAVQQFTVSIIPRNDPPVISAIPDTSTRQDTPFHLPLRLFGHDVDNPWSQLTWNFSTLVSEVVYQAGSDTLTLIPPTGFVGYDTVRLSLSDAEGLTVCDTFCLRYKDTQPPSFVIGIFQNPVVSAYLDLYFFPSEKISQVRSVTIGSESKTVTLVTALNPSPYHCHHQLKASEVKEVTIIATDTMENVGTTRYAFSASDVFAKAGGIVFSPDSSFSLKIPPAALSKDGFVLCLPNTVPAGRKSKEHLDVLAKQYSPGDDLRYTYQSTATLRQPAKLEFHPSKLMRSNGKIGIIRVDNGQSVYHKTYTNSDGNVFWIYTDKLGTFGVAFDAPEPPQIIPDQCTLSQNYPNPFNPVTTISFTLPELSSTQFVRPARLIVYDLLGREVIRLLDKPCLPGVYQLTWNGRNAAGIPLASGMYFYTLEYGQFYKSRKMVLIK